MKIPYPVDYDQLWHDISRITLALNKRQDPAGATPIASIADELTRLTDFVAKALGQESAQALTASVVKDGTVPDAAEMATLQAELVKAQSEVDELHSEHVGKAMQQGDYLRFATLRDETIPDARRRFLAVFPDAESAEGHPARATVRGLLECYVALESASLRACRNEDWREAERLYPRTEQAKHALEAVVAARMASLQA